MSYLRESRRIFPVYTNFVTQLPTQSNGAMPNFFVAKMHLFCYNGSVMEKRKSFYVSPKSGLTWLVALCMVCSAVARVLFIGVKGTDVWSQIVLPIAAVLLFGAICLFSGKERFYKTAIPFWMICIYYGFLFWGYDFGNFDTLIGWLFAAALLFLAVLYTQITCGKVPATSLILLLAIAPFGALLYLNRDNLQIHTVLADGLMTLGLVLVVFAIRVHPAGEYHLTWGDRLDGRRVRGEPPMSQVTPYLMWSRCASMNLFADSIEISNAERYIRQKRREGLTSFGIMHVMLAAYCRAVCKYPGINRFISGQKLYTHGNDIQFCLTVKKDMSTSSPDTVIKVHLAPTDTPEDIYNKINKAVENVKNTPLDSDMDHFANLLTMIPGLFLRLTVYLLRFLDYFGLLPRFLLELSPFHGSVFFTSMGSLGIPPVFHHLYDFGNIPIFVSFGCKRRELEVQEDGSVVQKKYVDIKISTDERTVDGFYYATFFKHYKHLLHRPEMLDVPPRRS